MQKRDFSLYGAVDLGARAAVAKKQQERSSQEGQPTGAGFVLDVTDETFNAEVIERSLQVPVMVAFVVDREPVCDELMSGLTKLVGEGQGAWLLARVDIEVNRQLQGYLQQLRVQSLPFVGVVVQGQLMPFLNGPAPEAELRTATEELWTALKEQGLMGDLPPAAESADEPEDEVDPVHAAAEDALARGDHAAAAQAYRSIVEKDPADEFARRRLALTELSVRVRGYGQGEFGADAASQLKAADVELLNGDVDGAFDRLIAVVRATSGDERNAARLHLLSLFETLPADDTRITRARRALQAALF
ncbi:MAG: tetratricopeptide repeat protein [Streptosporangiaceae bacterium]